jgi:hypothetical protein
MLRVCCQRGGAQTSVLWGMAEHFLFSVVFESLLKNYFQQLKTCYALRSLITRWFEHPMQGFDDESDKY